MQQTFVHSNLFVDSRQLLRSSMTWWKSGGSIEANTNTFHIFGGVCGIYCRLSVRLCSSLSVRDSHPHPPTFPPCHHPPCPTGAHVAPKSHCAWRCWDCGSRQCKDMCWLTSFVRWRTLITHAAEHDAQYLRFDARLWAACFDENAETPAGARAVRALEGALHV